jgi:putative MATE family efflux protein
MNNMRTEILTSGMGQLFFKLAVPGIIGTLILGLYNFVDGIFVGQLIGPEALGGVTLVYSIVLINQAVLTLFGIGAMAVLSIAVGQNDHHTINRLLGHITIPIGIITLIFSVLVFSFSEQIITFLGGKGSISDYGQMYLNILSTGFVFAAIGPAINMLFRGEGNIKQAMKILSAGVVLNIILDFVFIYILKMGVQGAAWATVISQIVLVLINIIYIMNGNSVITFRDAIFSLSPQLIMKIVGIGSSSMIRLLMASIQQILLFKTLSAYKDPALIPLLGAAYRVFLFVVIPFAGLGQGLQSITGINYGAGKYNRVKSVFNAFTSYASVIAGILWILLMILPKTFLGMMISDKEIINSGVPFFRTLFSTFIFTGFINNSSVFFQSLGKGLHASLIALSRQILFFIPALIILPIFFGVNGVWFSMPAAEFLTVGVILFLLIREYRNLKME